MPKFCSNAAWNPTGIQFPDLKKQLKHPRSIFIDINDNVYVSFDKKGLVIVWYSGIDDRLKIYFRDSSFSSLSNFVTFVGNAILDFFGLLQFDSDVPNSLFVTSEGDIYVGNAEDWRIDKWARNSTGSHINLSMDGPCYGLFVDINDTIYCSVKPKDKVIMKSIKHDQANWIVKVENRYVKDGKVKTIQNLNGPYGIFVDINFSLYVADYNGNRIQLFERGQIDGTTIVNNDVAFEGKNLYRPTNIVLDIDNNLYIVDSHNHRVVFFAVDSSQRRCLVGCSKKSGSQLNQLSYPIGISFDRSGSLLISDANNNRVLKFLLGTGLYGRFAKYPSRQ